MSVAQVSPVQAPVRVGLASWQWMLFVAQPLILLAATLWSQASQGESFKLLFTESLGRQMLVQAGIYFVLNVVILIAGCWLLNRLCTELPTLRYAVTTLLHIGCFIFLFMPAVWVLVVGPAALNIMRSLAN